MREVKHNPAGSGDPARLETLDALRGVVALLVVVFHINFLPFNLLSNAYVGIDCFFVLSGFVIAKTYEGRLRQGYSFGRFIEARLIRIYPMYFVGHLLGAALVAAWLLTGDADAPPLDVAAAGFAFGTFLLPAPNAAPEADFYPMNGPFWSLLFEFIAYIYYGLFAARLSNRALMAVVACAGAILVLIAIQLGHLEVGSTWATAAGGLCRVIYSYTMGVLLMRLLPAGNARRTSWAFLPLALLVVVLGWPIAPQHTLAFDIAAVLFFCPAIIALGAMLRPSAISTGACRILGEISYPVYVIHFPLIAAAGFIAKMVGLPQAVWSSLFVVAVAVAALVLSRVWDTPVRAWLTAKARERVSRVPQRT